MKNISGVAFSVFFIGLFFLNCSNKMDEQSEKKGQTGSFSINNNDSYVYSHLTTLNMNISKATEMRFRNEGQSWSNWETYTEIKDWTITTCHGKAIVFGEFRDNNGNVLDVTEDIIVQVEEKLIASDGLAVDTFGGFNNYGVHGSQISISEDGNTIVVGACQDDVGSNFDQGSAYVYKWDGSIWNETQLKASDGLSEDRYGFSVSVAANGNTVIVGSWQDDVGLNGNQGSVYIYRWNGSSWIETKLVADDGAVGDNFGLSVALSADGNTAVVGSYHDMINSNAAQGSAYIFKWNGISWDQTKLIASDGATNDQLGFHVAISGDGNTAVAGAIHASLTGAIYIYSWNGSSWVEKKITASNGATGDWFGRIVSANYNGTIIATGAYHHDVSGKAAQGMAYVYKWDGTVWNESIFTASDGSAQDYYGYSVCLSGDGNSILVGALMDDEGSNLNQGSAYLYRFDGSQWNESKIIATDGVAEDLFGYSVWISSDGYTFAVGAPARDVDGKVDQGVVYVY